MKSYVECIPCSFNHALRTARVAGASVKQQREILNQLGGMVKDMPLTSTPPELARLVNHLVSTVTGKKDVYKKIKMNSNARALDMYAALKARVRRAEDPLLEAVECAIAGNVIDYGIHNAEWIERELKRILRDEKKRIATKKGMLFRYKKFKAQLRKSQTILYLGDNAGETVFDRLLIETIQSEVRTPHDIVYVVKSAPAINDALMADARFCGLDKVATLMASGSDAPGTVLSLCTREFKDHFKRADMIISKGQGNFEALSAVTREVFFLLMVKCPVIAKDIELHSGACSVGDTVLLHHV